MIFRRQRHPRAHPQNGHRAAQPIGSLHRIAARRDFNHPLLRALVHVRLQRVPGDPEISLMFGDQIMAKIRARDRSMLRQMIEEMEREEDAEKDRLGQ